MESTEGGVPQLSGRNSAAARAAVRVLSWYKRWISPFLPPACRFEPTCSVYASDAISKYGVLKGLWLGMIRLAKCHPFHPGGHDPVP